MKFKSLPGMVAIAFLALTLTAAAFGQNAPKIAIKQTEHNFGEVNRGATLQHSFVFKNEGKADLEIRNVAPTCGCTASEFTKVVPPGQDGKITLSINTAGFNGAVTKTAEVYTNDPARERFTLMLGVMIKSDEAQPGTRMGPFVASPSNQWLARIPRGMSTNGLIAVTNASAQLLKITKVESDGDAFTYELQTIEEGKRYALSFTSSAKLPAGTHRQMMKLATESKETPVIELKLEAIVSPAVTISPTSLTFDNVPVSDPEMEISLVSKFLWVRLGRGTGLEVTSMTSDLPFVKVKVESTGANGAQVLLRVGFSEKPPKGTQTGKIKLTTNNPDVKEAEVPITVTAR